MFPFRYCQFVIPSAFANIAHHTAVDLVSDDKARKNTTMELMHTVQEEDKFWNSKVQSKHKDKEHNQQGNEQPG